MGDGPVSSIAFTRCSTSRAGAAPPFFMTRERKMRVLRAGAAPPFVHHQTRRFAPGAVASPAIFLASERKAWAAPAIYVNIR